MAGTLAFSKIIIMDIFRNRGRTLSSIIGVVLAVSLITGQNIALDTTARDVLNGELEDYEYDFLGLKQGKLSKEETQNISDDIKSIKGVNDVTPLSQTSIRMEIHSDNTIDPPKYGYYEKSYDMYFPDNRITWLNATLDPIPIETYRVFGHVYSQYDGKPLDNISVVVFEGNDWDLGYSEETSSDENGYYEFLLPLAEYTIYAILDDYATNDYIVRYQAKEITVTSDPLQNQVNFYIYETESSTLSGEIIDLDLGVPSNDSHTIVFRNHNTFEETTTEYFYILFSQIGPYNITLVPGRYKIEIYPDVPLLEAKYENIEIEKNSSIAQNLSVFHSFQEDAIIEGYVRNDLNGEGIFGESVQAYADDSSYSNMSLSGTSGYYEMNITSGNITLQIEGGNTFLDEEINFTIQPGEQIHYDFSLTPLSSRIRGSLQSTQGNYFNDALLKIVDIDFEYELYYSSALDYDMPPGNYTISFDAKPREDIIDHRERELTFYEIPRTPDGSNIFRDLVGFELEKGTFDPMEGELVITDRMADEYDLDVGENINLLIRRSFWDTRNQSYNHSHLIWTYNVSGIVGALDFFDNRIFRIGNPYSLFINETDYISLGSDFSNNSVHGSESTRFYIKIARDKIIDPLSRDSTDYKMLRLLTKINTQTITEHMVRVNNLIDRPLRRYYTWFESYRIEMLAYSLPVIAVGFYLGIVGVELATTQKRRTLGIIKSRGASDKQVFTSLIMESVVLGIIAGALGLILGVVVSRVFLTIIPGAKNVPSSADFLSFHITASSIIWGIIFAIFLLVMASLKPAKRISKSPIIESIHQQTDSGKEKEYKPGLDIFLVSFAIIAFIVVSEININEIDPSEMGQLFTILLFIIYIGSAIWLPFSPFILMFSLTRLLTRGTNRVYKFFSRAVKPFSKDLWYIIHKNLSRNPKKVSMVSIIIALALGFGVFMTSMIGTTVNGQELEAKAEIGGDLNVIPEEVNGSFEHELEGIEGVKEVIAVNWLFGSMISGEDYESRRITVFDSKEYKDHVEVGSYFFIEGTFGEALDSVSKGFSVIVGEDIAGIYSLNLGDSVRIEDPFFPSGANLGMTNLDFKTDNFIVAGIVRVMPGLEIPVDEPDHYDWGSQIYMDFSALEENITIADSGWRFIIDVEGSAKEVESQIRGDYQATFWEIKNLESELDDINNNLSSRSILYLMFVNIGFLIIIITAGLGLIMFISIGERKNEFATIMARGAEGKQMGVIIMGEALSITLVGAMVGIFSGVLTAYTFNRMLSANTLFGISGGTLSDRPLVIPWYTILIIFIALLALVITSAVAAYKVKRIKLHSALRIRGG